MSAKATLPLAKGDRYRLPLEDRTREYTFVKRVAGGPLIFLDEVTGKPRPIKEHELVGMIADKLAVPLLSSNWIDRIEIYALMDPSTPGTTVETRKKIVAAQEKVAEGAMLLFYVKRFDAEGNISKSKDGLNDLIGRNYLRAVRAGHFSKPSWSAVYRALAKGVPHERCLADFVSKRGNHSKRTWTDPWVQQKLREAVDLFYSEGNPKPPELHEAVTSFLGQAILEDQARQAKGEPALEYPKKTAVEYHIKGEETRERLARRDPLKALKDYNGTAEGAKAEFPLQQVQVDQTEIDEWIPIYDEDGNIVDKKRPWLVSIIDVYSRMILAAVLTFEKPSTYTVQLAIKQMLRPKLFLIERYGRRKGATDGHGQTKGITFDNAVENIGFSMRTLLGDASIDMDVAPIATPQAKAIVERCFHTYNQGIWHKAPGGIPHKPHILSARRLKPQERAQWALDFATGVMWHWIVNVYHLKRNRTLGGVPARLWSEKVNDPMVGRSVSKRLDLVDVICGTRKRLKIDGSGVLFDTHLFHHKKITEEILRYALPKEKRSARGKRGKVDVEAIIYPHDCSHITIVDHVRKRFVRLPNSNPTFAEGLSYAQAKMIRLTDRALDRQFVSEEELILAKYRFFKLIDSERAQARAERAILQAKRAKKRAEEDEDVNWTLVDGDYIELGSIEPSVDGGSPYDVPQEMAAMERSTPLIPHIGQTRNGKKAEETRANNKKIKDLRDAAKTPVVEEAPPPNPAHWALPLIENPSAFLDALAEDLD